jgi:hypothetical protein
MKTVPAPQQIAKFSLSSTRLATSPSHGLTRHSIWGASFKTALSLRIFVSFCFCNVFIMSDSQLEALQPPPDLFIENVRRVCSQPCSPTTSSNDNTNPQLASPHQTESFQVPAVSTSLASDIGRYNDFRGHSLVDWRVGQEGAHREMEMLVCHRPGTDTSQLFRLNVECGQLLPLTQMCDDAVTSGCFEPVHGRHAVFQRSRGGNEEVRCIFCVTAARVHYFAAPCSLAADAASVSCPGTTL